MSFNVLIMVLYAHKNLSTSQRNCFVYFKYPWKTPGKVQKMSLSKTLDFLNYESV